MIYSGPLRPILVFDSPLAGSPTAGVLSLLRTTRDLSDLGGNGRIAGTVNVDSTPDYPVWRRVRLFAKRDGRLVREQWSNPETGAYSFDYINSALEYVVIAHDHTGVFNAEVRDSITPEAIP